MSETHLTDRNGLSSGLPLLALRAFEAAARHLSLRDGASELGLSPSAVSHHIRNLEGMLGVRLLVRLARGVETTEAGAALAAALTPAFRAIGRAYAAAGGASLHLRLSAAPLFAARYILPDLDVLQSLSPGVTFAVESTLERRDATTDPQLMTLHFGPQPAGLFAVEVARTDSCAVAAPQVAEILQTDPNALAAAPLLALTRRRSHWPAALKTLGLHGARREVYFDSIEGVLRAAEAGHGVALLPTLVCADAVREGRLVQVLPDTFDNGWRYWLAAAPDTPAAKRVSTVARWLQAQVARAEGRL